MPNGEVLNIVGRARDVSLHITDHPLIATIRWTFEGAEHTLSLMNPSHRTASEVDALEVLTYVFGEFYGFIVTDRNESDPNCLEFGRYKVELQTYDGGMGEVLADRYTHSCS